MSNSVHGGLSETGACIHTASERCSPKVQTEVVLLNGVPSKTPHSPPFVLRYLPSDVLSCFDPSSSLMPVNRAARRSASERACLECQKRKTKCVAAPEAEVCAYCQKAGKTCVFEGPHERTSLTRRNLDAAEARCKELERLLQEVRTNARTNPAQVEASREPDRRPQDAEDPTAGPYEWNEGLDTGANDPSPDGEYTHDGMASLTRHGNGSGYLGEDSP